MAAVALWCQLFFWFRLFDSLAQYVDLILTTVSDVKNFMVVLGALIVMFASGIYMLQLNRMNVLPLEGEDIALFPYEDYQGSLLWAGLFNQYLVMLGDFNMTLQ